MESRLDVASATRHGDLLAALHGQLADERRIQQAQIASIASSANRWFVGARDVIVERLDKLIAQSEVTGGPPSGALGAIEAEIRELRGDLAALDAGLGGLWSDLRQVVGRQPLAAPATAATRQAKAGPASKKVPAAKAAPVAKRASSIPRSRSPKA